MLERLFSTDQIAELLGTSPSAVHGWIQRGWLPPKRLPDGRIRISEHGLVRFLKDRGVDIAALMARISERDSAVRVKDLPVGNDPEPQPDEQRQLSEEAAPAAPTEEEAAPTETEPGLGPEPEAEGVAQAEPSEAPEANVVEACGDCALGRVRQVAEAILRDAVALRATHIHLDRTQDKLTLRLRIDGVLHEKGNFRRRLPEGLAWQLCEHFRSLAGLSAELTGRPVSAGFRWAIEDRQVEFRLTCCPTVGGEKVLLRVLDAHRAAPDLASLGIAEEDADCLRRVLDEPCGLVVLAGTSGSVGWSLARAISAELEASAREIIAIEDRRGEPVDSATHLVATEAGLTLAEAVRASGELDGDVLLIRGLTEEAASAAFEAVSEGRMVVATVFARGVSEALEMMVDSIDKWTLASALAAVAAYVPVRKLCDECKVRARKADFPVYRPGRCAECGRIGYAGTVGLLSVLHVEGQVRRLLRRGAGAAEVVDAAVSEGMRTLRDCGIARLREGVTSREELRRVLG